MKDRARVVVIGAGIAGSSIAYHLTELGWRDVVVIEQGKLAGGTTSHAPGLVGQLRSSATLTRLLMHSVGLYRGLSFEGTAGFMEVGSLRLASSPDRLQEIKRQAGFARTLGLPAEVLGPRETQKLFPLISLEGVRGSLYLPTDGSARAPVLARALARAAEERGVAFYPETAVTGFEVMGGRIRAVITSRGRVETEVAVAACGIWSPAVAGLLGIPVPLVPMEHQYAATAPLPELEGPSTLPNLRDPDLLVYFRQDGPRLVLGGYERNPLPFPGKVPGGEDPSRRPFDAARFESLLEGSRRRLPLLQGATLEKTVSGLESFTPDGEFIVGESKVGGFWLACGFCAHGISGSGGIGKAVAEWIVEGEPSLDLWHMDLKRFALHARSPSFVRKRAMEVYSTYYDISLPGREWTSARGLRLSPLYGRLKGLGAVFGEKAGWERPNWFEPNRKLAPPEGWPAPRGWARRLWPAAVGAEHQAARERVALFDETSFSKFELLGSGAAAFLERIAANRMDRSIGSVTYTQMLNRRGGIECDLTVTRLAEDRFQVITGTAFGLHDLSWIRSHLPADGSVQVRDVTSSLACIGVWGPRARDLVQSVSEDDFSNGAFRYLTAREVCFGDVSGLAVRVTYVGELGWEIYVPVELGLKLWDLLWEAGRPHGAVAGGYRAIDSLRLEKGYRYWSQDIHSEYNPFEAGLGFAVKLEKGDFIGREALLRAREEGTRRKLCCLVLDDARAVALGGEPILEGRDGGAASKGPDRILGRVTSAGFGFTVGKSIAYGYLPAESAQPGTRVAIGLFGRREPAVVTEEPLYDPKGEKIRT